MINKKTSKLFIASFILSVCSSYIYAANTGCAPALVVVRHAEDNDPPKDHVPANLTGSGYAHRDAYQKDLPKRLSELGYCKPKYFVASNSTNPILTVEKSAQENGKDDDKKVHTFFNGKELLNGFNWKDKDFLSSLIKPDQSTFMSLSKEVMWGKDGKNLDWGMALASFSPSNYDYINSTPHEQPFNLVYVFSNPDKKTKQFKNLEVFLQLYEPQSWNPYLKKNVNCEFRLNGKNWLSITGLAKFEGKHFNNFANDHGCFF